MRQSCAFECSAAPSVPWAFPSTKTASAIGFKSTFSSRRTANPKPFAYLNPSNRTEVSRFMQSFVVQERSGKGLMMTTKNWLCSVSALALISAIALMHARGTPQEEDPPPPLWIAQVVGADLGPG